MIEVLLFQKYADSIKRQIREFMRQCSKSTVRGPSETLLWCADRWPREKAIFRWLRMERKAKRSGVYIRGKAELSTPDTQIRKHGPVFPGSELFRKHH